MHRHRWSPWKFELREHLYETEASVIKDKEGYNTRICTTCGFTQEKKAKIY